MALRFVVSLLFLARCYSQPAYHAQAPVSGIIRIWGSAQTEELVQRWQQGFARRHPMVRFEDHLFGAASAIGGLYTGVADLVVSREIWPIESLAFEQVQGHKPAAFEVATGSFDVPTKSDSLDIFVHRDNPISGLTLAQLARIFGSDGGSDGARTWGEMGLGEPWTTRPINTYGFKIDNAGMMLFANIAMHDGRWNPHLREFTARPPILEALARDPAGIAISNAHYARPEVRMLPIAAAEGGPYILPSRKTVADRTYPLSRRVYIFFNHSANAAEFLRYVLSRDGQNDVVAEGDYLPLPPAIALEQARKLR